MSNDTVLRIPLADAADEGFTTVAECAKVAGITELTVRKRLRAVKLLGPDAPVAAFGTRETAGRPARLFPRDQAFEACLNSVGDRRTPAEKDQVNLDLAPEATAADEALAAIASMG